MAVHTIELSRPFGPDSLKIDGRQILLEDSTSHRNHSPTGFSWGYAGSGCAQTALAILLATVGEEQAERHYQAFKRAVIARCDQNTGHVFVYDIDGWIEQREGATQA